MNHYPRDEIFCWDSGTPNPLVSFPNQPTLVARFQFWASYPKGHATDPEPYLPGQVHGLHGPSYIDNGLCTTSRKCNLRSIQKNGITNCTMTCGPDETRAFRGHPPHVLCRGFTQIDFYGAEAQNPARQRMQCKARPLDSSLADLLA
ncbi:uncharacterized protein EAF01_001103 [Botrytis porri]|uniref:uncharacterized protein n=1 Tax=Botrytis porri TaxID=87229 RepID=UPI001900C771|nr:uncharacterized protein EAF01_001103 [Botrytis porri]KAF7914697.1 hypothetical protein EAF01_001103 [Botrytis porri]